MRWVRRIPYFVHTYLAFVRLLFFLVFTCILLFFPYAARSQHTDYFCEGSTQSDEPEFQAIKKWIHHSGVSSFTLPYDEVVHLLLSQEAMVQPWSTYPCLNLQYHYLLSNALRKVGAYEEAERAGRLALEIDSLMGGRFAPEIFSHLASIAYERKDYAEAIYFFQRNYELVRYDTNTHGVLGALNNIGLSYFMSDSLDRAEEIFLEAYQSYIYHRLRPQSLLASLLDNRADVALVKGDTLSAIQLLLQKDSLLQVITDDSVRMYDTWASLAALYLSQHQPRNSLAYLQKAEAILPLVTNLTADDAYHLELTRYKYSVANGDPGATLRSAKKLQSLRDRANAEQIERHQTEVDVLHQYADYNVAQERALAMVQIEKKEQEQRFQKRITILIILLGLLGLLGLYIYFSLRAKVSKQRIEGLEVSVSLNAERLKSEKLERELIQRNLEASEKELISIALDNVRRKEWTREMMDKMDSVVEKPVEKQPEGFKKLYHELMHESQIQERLTLAHENQDLIQTAFVQKLKTAYHDLTPAEIDLCILIRLGLTGKEIAVVRNIDPESIRKAKYRLRQKMNLSTPEELKDFLNSISKS